MFSFHSKKTQNFQQAKNSCISIGSRLAVIDDKQSWNEIKSYENTESPWSYWWLGAEKQEGQEDFYWLDGNVFEGDGNELTISQDAPGNRCLALYTRHSTKSFKLFSWPCDRHLYYICEGVKSDLNTDVMNSTTAGDQQVTNTAHGTGIYTSIFSETVKNGAKATSLPTVLQTLNNPQKIADDKLFSPSTDSDVDQASWMFVALALALLLVVSIVIIAKLWTENKKLRNRVKATPFLKSRQEDYNLPSQRNNATVTEGWRNGPTESIAMSSTRSYD